MILLAMLLFVETQTVYASGGNASGGTIGMTEEKTLRLSANITKVNEPFLEVENGEDITLYLNGHTISSDYGNNTITVKTGGKLTIVGPGTIDKEWNEVESATGYRIYRKSNGKWIQVVKAQKDTICMIDGLKRNTKYTFAIRTYKIENKKVIWSDRYKTVTARTTRW